MATPNDLTSAEPPSTPASHMEELREKLRPRDVVGADELLSARERDALERVQALELQLLRAHERERESTELAVRDGNRIAVLEARVTDLSERAARADEAERALFEAESRSETAVRRTELMESELMSTRAEVDRLRTRVVELEASLRRALAEIGTAAARREREESEAASGEAGRLEASAERSIELADRLRLKVVDLESNLRAVMQQANETTAARMRADQAERELEAVREGSADATARASEAEGRLAELEGRLEALDTRIAGWSDPTTSGDDNGELVVDLRDAAEEPVELPDEESRTSRWSEWRAT
jgi:chromosome segregation ATPase